MSQIWSENRAVRDHQEEEENALTVYSISEAINVSDRHI